MRTILTTAAIAVLLSGWAGAATADPDKDESGKGRWRGGYERSDGYPDRFGYERPRRERRAFKQEYDDGNCKYERKLEKSSAYKEGVKCRNGRPRRTEPSYGYDFPPNPSYGYRY
jgi:hypothetical protein